MDDDFMTTTYLNPSMFPQKDVRIYVRVVITTNDLFLLCIKWSYFTL